MSTDGRSNKRQRLDAVPPTAEVANQEVLLPILEVTLSGLQGAIEAIKLLKRATESHTAARKGVSPIPVWIQNKGNRVLPIPKVPLLLDDMYAAEEKLEDEADRQKRIKFTAANYNRVKKNLLKSLEHALEFLSIPHLMGPEAKTIELVTRWATSFHSFLRGLEPFSFEQPPRSLTAPVNHLDSDTDICEKHVRIFVEVLVAANVSHA